MVKIAFKQLRLKVAQGTIHIRVASIVAHHDELLTQ